jgi:hypothetical protein
VTGWPANRTFAGRTKGEKPRRHVAARRSNAMTQHGVARRLGALPRFSLIPIVALRSVPRPGIDWEI